MSELTELQKKIIVYIFLVSIVEYLGGQRGRAEVSIYTLYEKLGASAYEIDDATATKNEYWYTCSEHIGLKDEGREIASQILMERLFSILPAKK
ncbi:MAG: hypothetical protein WCT49_02060 [Candidatus Paceibacterota bacterium]|jgi:hypothetical protein|nr:hypothetical protein [Candidatus Paceibacterota bacterium]